MKNRRVGFKHTWLRPGLDLEKYGLESWNHGLTRQQRASYTIGVVALFVVFTVFVDLVASLLVLGVGVWVIWNPGNRITPLENRIFITVVATVALFGLLGPVATLLKATGLLVLVYIGVLFLVWRPR